MSKEEKLTAARKKLKEFQTQQKNKDHVIVTQAPVDCKNENINHDLPVFHQLQEVNSTPSHFEISAIKNEQQLPNLSQYFSEPNENSNLFDIVPQCDPFFTKSNDIPNPTFSYSSMSTSPTSLPTEANSPSFSVTQAATCSVTAEETNTLSDLKSDFASEALKKELALSEIKIKMQAEALDVVTAEREEVQLKLQIATEEIKTYKENLSALQNELSESRKQQKELNQLVSDFGLMNQATLMNTQTLEQNINELKERNEELEHLWKMQVEKNAVVQTQLDESQSEFNMLVLKFQQLGIETTHDNTDYKTICEETNTLKRKYSELEEQFRTLAFEKEHTNNEYRQYIQNLQTELNQAKTELQKLSIENQELVEKISSQTEHINNFEKMLQKPHVRENEEELVNNLKREIVQLKEEIDKKKEQFESALSEVCDYEEWKQKAISLEEKFEALKVEMMNTNELQMAIESHKVAASQAISQNNKLKFEHERLNSLIDSLNEEKRMLALSEEKARKEIKSLLQSIEQMKTEPRNITVSNAAVMAENTSLSKNDAAINTEAQDGNDEYYGGKTNIVAMQQLQEKFKSVLDKMADLTDEKQQLEHLVLQLQSETETIEEYVALYQNQRSILQQRARETDLKMEQVAIEKQRLLNVIHSILTVNISDRNVVKQLIQQNLSVELTNELNLYDDTRHMNSMSADMTFNNEFIEHHPSCHCCSGKLITI